MSIQDLLIGVLVGVIANFLTPVIRTWFIKSAVAFISKSKGVSLKVLEIRLNQLRSERKYIEEMAKQPLIMANITASCAVRQALSLWIVVLVIVFHAANNNWVLDFGVTPLSGIVFGLIGYATRFPLAMIVILADLEKINRLDVFLSNNMDSQNSIESRIRKQSLS